MPQRQEDAKVHKENYIVENPLCNFVPWLVGKMIKDNSI
jgi:hypothetical protein